LSSASRAARKQWIGRRRARAAGRMTGQAAQGVKRQLLVLTVTSLGTPPGRVPRSPKRGSRLPGRFEAPMAGMCRAVAHQADVQARISHGSQPPDDGVVDPVIRVAEGAPAQAREQRRGRAAGRRSGPDGRPVARGSCGRSFPRRRRRSAPSSTSSSWRMRWRPAVTLETRNSPSTESFDWVSPQLLSRNPVMRSNQSICACSWPGVFALQSAIEVCLMGTAERAFRWLRLANPGRAQRRHGTDGQSTEPPSRKPRRARQRMSVFMDRPCVFTTAERDS
jgi:hypothetical protein